jgi:hypothetical protein
MSKTQAVNIGDKYPQGEYDTFISALRKILRVSHSDMQQRLAAEKKARASKLQPSSRASRDRD